MCGRSTSPHPQSKVLQFKISNGKEFLDLFRGCISLDMGLYKSFKMPWEGHALQFRWEVFNVTNTQRFDGLTISDLSLGTDPFLGGNPNSDFGQFTSTQAPLNDTKAGRVMQFALRYTF
jgi:hypothetical protein